MSGAGPPLQALPSEAAPPRDAVLVGFDGWLLAAGAALLGIGLVMVASASTSIAARASGEPLYYLWRQALFVLLGLAGAGLAMRLPLAVWRHLGPWLLALVVVLLAAVLVPGVGREVNGSRRWLALGAFHLQPSELLKPFFVIYLAGYLVRREEQVRSTLAGFTRPIAVVTLLAGLLLAEPDYGATVVLFATTLGMLFLAGVPLRTFALWVLLIGVALALMVVLKSYRLERLLAFLNPWDDPFRSGFQLTQALIAIGRGGLLGAGLGAGVQKLFYLPEAHTDFLFAVLAEELGLAGAMTVIGLFTLLLVRAMLAARRAARAGQRFAAHLGYGLAMLIALQAYINLGVNLGLLPTKGLTLPLMSYGGSSLVASCLALGLIARVGREAPRRPR